MTIKIMPISDLRRHTSDVIQAVQEGSEAVYITQHGRPVVVLVTYEQYERLLGQSKRRLTGSEPHESYTDYLAGLHREVWEGTDTDTYLQQERDAWDPSKMP